MGKYKINYHPSVLQVDFPRLGSYTKRILKVVYKKLVIYPDIYGKPLRFPLKKYWKLRVENYRVVFEIKNLEVKIIVIGHRKEIYQIAIKRLGL
jgi:mRNA interferase RelE/StbE